MKKRKILAIVDNITDLQLLKTILSKSFPEIEFLSVLSGKEGLENCYDQLPDIIFLDINILLTDGFEICRELKSDTRTRTIPVVVITDAGADKQSRIKAMEMGTDGFLEKPVDELLLIAEIRAMLRIKESEDRKIAENSRLKQLVAERTKELEASRGEMEKLLEELKDEIEQRKRTEGALRESEERFINLFERAPLGYQSLDENGCFVEVNEAWCNTLGYSRDEVLGKWFGDFLDPNYVEAFRERFPLFKKLGQIHSEFRMLHKTGKLCFIAFEGRVGYKENGSFEKTHCIIQDITEQTLANEALRISEEKYRDIFENIQDIYYEADIDGTILVLSPSIKSATDGQFKAGDLIGKSIYDFYSRPDEREMLLDILRKKKSVTDYEITLKNRDGSLIPCSISSKLVFDENGRPIKTLGSIRDISERKKTDEALRESEEKYRTMVDLLPDAVIVHAEGKVVFANQAAFRLVGATSADQLLGKTALDFVHPDDRESALSRIQQIYKSNGPSGYGVERFINLNNEVSLAEVIGIPVNYLGKPAVQTIIRDITERRRAEIALQDQKKEFETIFNLVPAQIWYKDTQNNIVRVNRQVCNDIGLPCTKLEGRATKDLFPEFADQYYADDLEVIRSGKPKLGIIEQIKNYSGELKWHHTNKVPVFDDNGEVKGVIAFALDITQSKENEDALKANRERWENLFNNSPASIAVYRAVDEGNDFVFTDFNLSAQKTEKLKREDVVGKRISEMFPGAGALGFLDVFRRVWKTGKTEQIRSSYYKDNRIEGWRENIIYRLNTGEIVAIYDDVTDRMKAEIALRESEETFRNYFENSLIGKSITGIDGSLKVNESFCRMVGYSKEELLRMNWAELTHPDDVELSIRMQNSMLNGEEESVWFEKRFRHKSGKIIWAEVSIKLQKDANGKPLYFITTTNDITERKYAQNEIMESNSRMELAMETANMAWWKMDMKTGAVTFAKQKAEMLGFDPDEFKHYVDFVTLVHPEDRERTMEAMRSHLAGRAGKYEVQYRIRNKSGDYQWLYDVGTVTARTREGEPLTVTGLVLNISNQKKIESKLTDAIFRAEKSQQELQIRNEELKARNGFIQTILDNLPIGVALNTIDEGTSTYMNKKFEEIYGWSSGEITSIDTFFEHVYPDAGYRREIMAQIIADIQSGDPAKMHWENIFITRKDGSQRVVNAVNIPLTEQNTMVSTVTDITDLHRSKMELVEAKERAEESDRLKSVFLANMSHEIRTPLNSIIGFSELMTDDDFNIDQQLQFAEMINTSGNQLLKTITDIMDFSKIEAGQVEIRKRKISVSQIVNEIISEFSYRAKEKGIDLIPDSQNPSEEVFIESDDVKIRQILVNLVGNALKFTKEGYVEIGVKVSGDEVCFHVKDTGIGVPAEFHESIFDRFLQVEPALTRQYGGTGLGLAISKSLVEILGGQIGIESEIGRGAKFYFRLPR